MSQNSEKVSAFVLHSKAYQENHLILQLFSLERGCFSVIAKGIKGKRSQARKAILQPFNQLYIEFIGKSQLKTLVHCELVEPQVINAYQLNHKALACAYYANELIIRALPESQEFSDIYQAYAVLIIELTESERFALLLRQFEILLLTSMGIAPDFEQDVAGNSIQPAQFYCLIPQSGFSLAHSIEQDTCYKGSCILALAVQNLSDIELSQADLKTMKLITRSLLQEVIGNKPLESKKLWQQINMY